MNLPRNDKAYPQKIRAAAHQPQFTLKTAGEKHLWISAGFLSNTDFLDIRDSLRKVVAQNAPEYLLDNLDEEGPDGDENMRDADEEVATSMLERNAIQAGRIYCNQNRIGAHGFRKRH